MHCITNILGLLGQESAFGTNARKHIQSHFELDLLLETNIKLYKSLIKTC